jgi:hypothetical protein
VDEFGFFRGMTAFFSDLSFGGSRAGAFIGRWTIIYLSEVGAGGGILRKSE